MDDSVLEACRVYLAGLPDDVAKSPLAKSSLVLASIMDDDSTSATARALCHKAFSDSLDKLGKLAPEKEGARVDDLKSRRDARRQRRTGTKS